MSTRASSRFLWRMVPLVVIAIALWAAFLVAHAAIWPDSFDPDRSRLLLWAMILGGGAATAATMIATFQVLRLPRPWWSAGAIALTAPAMCLDAIATSYFRDWFPDAATHAATTYPSVILGAVAIMQLIALALTDPGDTA